MIAAGVSLAVLVSSLRDASNGERPIASDSPARSEVQAVADSARKDPVVVADFGRALSTGHWPGLPADSRPSEKPVPRDPTPVGDPGDALQPLEEGPPLLVRVEAFEELGRALRPSAAYAIARAWHRCRVHRVQTAEDMKATAVRRIENRLRIAEFHLARTDDPVERESAIEELARLDRDAAMEREIADLQGRARLCEGTESISFDRRQSLHLEWLGRAARLGHPGARVDYAGSALVEGVSVGKAERIVEAKRRIAGYVRELLDARDVRGLLLLGSFSERGVYAAPNPELAYAYLLAARDALNDGRPTAWGTPAGVTIAPDMLQWRLARASRAIEPRQRLRAERWADEILAVPE